MTEIPRRNRLDQNVPAEKAIRDAIHAVEDLGADERLTFAVTLLGEALNSVADYVDENYVDENADYQYDGDYNDPIFADPAEKKGVPDEFEKAASYLDGLADDAARIGPPGSMVGELLNAAALLRRARIFVPDPSTENERHDPTD